MKTKKFKKKSGFEYLLGKAVDRKGMGMELALLVLLVVFACSTLLVSSALMGKDSIKKKEAELRLELELDAIAEARMADGDYELDDELKKKYGLEEITDGFEITDTSGKVLLTVKKNGEGKIAEWRYN